MNFAVHFAVFALCNSGAWFFRTLQQETWTWTFWLTAIWLTVLVGHAIHVFAIADYSK